MRLPSGLYASAVTGSESCMAHVAASDLNACLHDTRDSKVRASVYYGVSSRQRTPGSVCSTAPVDASTTYMHMTAHHHEQPFHTAMKTSCFNDSISCMLKLRSHLGLIATCAGKLRAARRQSGGASSVEDFELDFGTVGRLTPH